MSYKLSILTFILSISFVTNAQIVFNNTYDIDSSQNGVSEQIELEDGGYIVANQSFITNQYNSSFLMRIDPFGNEVWKNKIDLFLGNRELVTNLYKHKNFIYAIGVGTDTASNILNSFLYKFSLNGDSLYSKVFNDTLISASNGILFKNDYFYILQWTANQIPYTDVDVRILKTDTLGNILSEWIYGANDFDDVYDFKNTKNKGLILAGTSSSYSIDGNSDFIFIKLDSLGNVEWQKTYGTLNDESVRSYNYLENTIDDGYIMLGEENIYNPSLVQRTVVLKVDSLGNQMWRKEIELMEQTYALSLREWQDGSIIITGAVANYDTVIPLFNSVKSYLIKLTADGETEIWRRYFSKNWLESDEYVNGMMLTSDGGILITGWVSAISATNNDAWVVKFDSCGYTVGDVPTPFFVVDSIYKNKVYLSEQSENYCTGNIDWGDGTELETFYAYENNQPLAVKQLEHIYNGIGTYTITTTTLAGEETRSYEVDVAILDVGVGIESVIPAQAGISLFPNPANDYVIVQNPYSSNVIATPNISGEAICSNPADCFFVPHRNDALIMSIHTLNGKQIKTINLNPKLYQQKIDVSSLNNGVYFVRFEIDGELVSTEKLVIAR